LKGSQTVLLIRLDGGTLPRVSPKGIHLYFCFLCRYGERRDREEEIDRQRKRESGGEIELRRE